LSASSNLCTLISLVKVIYEMTLGLSLEEPILKACILDRVLYRLPYVT